MAQQKRTAQNARRTVRVRRHQRRATTGRATTVRSHNRSIAWQQARAAWAGAGVSGVTSLGLILQFGFTLIGTLALLLTILLGGLATMLTGKANAPKRRVKAKATARTTTTRKRR